MSGSESGIRRKVLFFAEAVTLAHMARPAVLARGLAESEFDVVLARDPRYSGLFPDLGVSQRDLDSISSEQFVAALAKGTPLYSSDILERYVEDDLRLIDLEKPDIVVGDFRLSLAVSARLRGVPYIAISNAYWSPRARVRYPIPDHPLTAGLPLSVAQALFSMARPLAFCAHAVPLNRVLKRYGLNHLGLNLNRVYTEADQVLYADVPQLVEMSGLPGNHRFMGPVLWSPEHRVPDWWEEINDERPSIYVALGSSGRSDLLPTVIEALSELPVQIMVSTAGKKPRIRQADNIFTADYLPGDAASQKANLIVSNGGSLTTYQAFEYGRPVLGIAGNLDQHLNMTAVESIGAGKRMRTDRLNVGELRIAAEDLMNSSRARQAALELRRYMHAMDPHATLLGSLWGLV